MKYVLHPTPLGIILVVMGGYMSICVVNGYTCAGVWSRWWLPYEVLYACWLYFLSSRCS